jgi:hypothetical protein
MTREVVRVDDPVFHPKPYQEFAPGLITGYCDKHDTPEKRCGMTAEESKFVDSVPVPYKEIDDMMRDFCHRNAVNLPKPLWSKKPPTVPGWYWIRRPGLTAVVKISKPWKDVIVQMAGCNDLIAMEATDKSCEWCGPLSPPE